MLFLFLFLLRGKFIKESKVAPGPRRVSSRLAGIVRRVVTSAAQCAAVSRLYASCILVSARPDLVNAERRNSIVCLIDMPHATAASVCDVCDFHAPLYCSPGTEVVPFGTQISPKEGKQKETETSRRGELRNRRSSQVKFEVVCSRTVIITRSNRMPGR